MDSSSHHALAFTIAETCLGDVETSRHIAAAVAAWADEQAEALGVDHIAWVAAAAVDAALSAAPSPGRHFDRPRTILAEELSSASTAARVAVALVGMCGLDRRDAAALTRRRLDELDALLEPFDLILDDLVALRPGAAPLSGSESGATSMSAPVAPLPAPPPPPWELGPQREPEPTPAAEFPTPPAATTPPATELGPQREPEPTPAAEFPTPPASPTPSPTTTPTPATTSTPEPARRRRMPVSVGTILTIAAIGAVIALITVPHGERPSFASPSATTSRNSDSACVAEAPQLGRALQVGAEQRPARLALPPGRVTSAPLIVVIGDTGQSAQDAVTTTGLEGAGAVGGDAVLTLDGSAQSWNVTATADAQDDIAMAADAIDQAAATGCVDAKRTVLVGYGTGAHLAAAIACSGNDHIRGLVMVRGAFAPPSCTLANGLTVVIDADTTDAILPYDGGWGITALPDSRYSPTGAREAFTAWAGLDACAGPEVHETDSSGVEVIRHEQCRNGGSVEIRSTTGFGHDWPADGSGVVARVVRRID